MYWLLFSHKSVFTVKRTNNNNQLDIEEKNATLDYKFVWRPNVLISIRLFTCILYDIEKCIISVFCLFSISLPHFVFLAWILLKQIEEILEMQIYVSSIIN